MPCSLHISRLSQYPDYLPPIQPPLQNHQLRDPPISLNIQQIERNLTKRTISQLRWASYFSNKLRSVLMPISFVLSSFTGAAAGIYIDQLTPSTIHRIIPKEHKAAYADIVLQVSYWQEYIIRSLAQQTEVLKALCRYQGLDEETDASALASIDRLRDLIDQALVGIKAAKEENEGSILSMGAFFGWTVGGENILTVGPYLDEWIRHITDDRALFKVAVDTIKKKTLQPWAMGLPGEVGRIKASGSAGGSTSHEPLHL